LSEPKDAVLGNESDAENSDPPAEAVDSTPPAGPKLPKRPTLRRLAKKIIASLSDDQALEGTYSQVTAVVIAHFCDIAGLDRSHIGQATASLSASKKQLFNFLIAQVSV
jgi:hypothetical protein